MKYAKRILSLVLGICLVFSLAISASALGTAWQWEFRNQFPMLSQGSGRTGYVCALQRFLSAHPTSASTIAAAGGVDGSFGQGTSNAVKKFQAYADDAIFPGSIAQDGIVGPDTWTSVACEMFRQGNYLKYGSQNLMLLSGSSLAYRNSSNQYVNFHTTASYLANEY